MDPANLQGPVQRRLQPLEAPERPNARRRPEEDYIDLRPFLLTLRARWRAIALITVSAATMVGIISALMLPVWYRATALIRPIASPMVESRLLGSLGGGLGGLTGAASLFGGGASSDAEEYVSILQSFQFNVTLAEHHRLAGELLALSPWSKWLFGSKPKDESWAVYRVLNSRFVCEYSMKTGNIELSFEGHTRADAERVLGYYVDDLRSLVRSRAIRSASSAIDLLEAEAASTPDPLLRTELYDLVAKHIERKKTAQVEADFALEVIDPPAASDRPYRPRVVLNVFITACLAVFLSGLIIVLRNPTEI